MLAITYMFIILIKQLLSVFMIYIILNTIYFKLHLSTKRFLHNEERRYIQQNKKQQNLSNF